jgi:hypothetical protein
MQLATCFWRQAIVFPGQPAASSQQPVALIKGKRNNLLEIGNNKWA